MHHMLMTLSRRMAVIGGLVLGALVLLTVISVAGRLLNGALHGAFWQGTAPELANALLSFGIGPINGDVELTEVGIAFAIVSFLPLCHIAGAHATVDVFASRFPPFVANILARITAMIFAATMVLITVQFFQGTFSKARSGQTTFLIEFPIWWAYAACLPGLCLATAVSVYLAVRAPTGHQQ
ncbi:TRAP transporter small permease [Pontivivens insulae]|uniref:TRAP transporter small permease protein n=1 Tax=Pontivivens insulae TaxID=1639689 RepID=A0A2R8A7H6_9RHOB|nr:TRAP transporter small permease subunit [Pontivivens insulae]RED18254.1 tripartite ATP-independent transporter DctQ subunit [Pontivivens insulae]SPF28152.1 hypothetical protein POI8812_00450 [Pontivivens insulae]